MAAVPADLPDGAIPQVRPAPRSRLEQLLGVRKAAIATAKEAQDRVDAIDAGIKAEVAAAFPGQGIIDIAAGPYRDMPALRLRWHKGTLYVPVGQLREKHPEVWEELKTAKRGSWQLHELEGGS